MIWSTPHDARISALSTEGKSNQDIAKIVTAEFGTLVSSEAVRKRLIRIRENAEMAEALPVVIENEETFVDDQPADGFKGLRHAYWDLETTDLSAFMGRLLCASIADAWGTITTRRVTDFPQESPLDDSCLAEWVRDELERYDLLIGWNSFNFDTSFLNARLLRWGKRPMRDMLQIDAMYKARWGRYGARVGSSKLDNASRFFRTKDTKSVVDWDTWNLASMGDEKAMDYVVAHCEADVLVLRDTFNHLKPLVRTIHR